MGVFEESGQESSGASSQKGHDSGWGGNAIFGPKIGPAIR